jgi:hypothetical protein
MFREMDWDTPLKRAKTGYHWRVILCAAIGAVVATTIWNTRFPHTHGFEKLWMGMTTGSSIGAIVGAAWQLRIVARRPLTSGWLLASCILGWGAFGLVSVFDMAPDMQSQELERSKIRSLVASNISVISLDLGHGNVRQLTSRDTLTSFVVLTSQAELYYPSHESCGSDFEMTIILRRGSPLKFTGCVPEQHPNDLLLSFSTSSTIRNVIVPSGRVWLTRIAATDGS